MGFSGLTKYFYYHESNHKKEYLDDSNWSKIDYKSGEDIGKELFQALRNPYNMNQPVIILGHPGAGKSMLSSQFAYKLIDNNEFVPFFIKLRDVDSTITDIDTHINKGISNTISGNKAINWTELAEMFPDKIPVIILDGFDELLRATKTELNDYILKIKTLQKIAQSSNLNIRVILTSRLTIMQDVKIPENSLVIKLDSFDEKRKKLWIKRWNKEQNNKIFKLPKRPDIDELSQEPLLLFLLALYDFEDNALNNIVNDNLNKSALYDKLFVAFTIRQLRKDNLYNSAIDDKKSKIEELFRLRIGFFASMLFIHDEVHHFEKEFDEELKIFGLGTEAVKAKDILDGFFFIHKDKSTDGHDIENLSFEFLHKTFGEFLASDFMLRMAKFRAEDDEDISHLCDEKYFRQIFAFQWIYKQPKILDFLFEHSKNIIFNNLDKPLKKYIKKELKNLVDENTSNTLPTTLNRKKMFGKLEHFSIYSQNLLLLWISIEDQSFEFYLSNSTDNIQSWKVFTDLWKNYGGYEYVSYLRQYIDVNINDKKVMISKIIHNNISLSDYNNYTHIANNNYQNILAYYDEEEFLLDNLLELDKDSYLIASVANLIIYKIEYLHDTNNDYFNGDNFWFIWKNSSFINKIKLSNFYFERNIEYNKVDVAGYLYNSIIKEELINIFENMEGLPKKENLSIYEAICAIEHFLKIEKYRYPARKMVENLFNTLGYKVKSLSTHNKMRLISLTLEVELNNKSHIVGDIVIDLFKELAENIDSLSTINQLKLIEQSLEINRVKEYAIYLLNNLLNKYKIELSFIEKLKFIELSFKIKGVTDYLVDMIDELLKAKKDKSLYSDKLKFVELYIEIKGVDQYVENILKDLFEESRDDREYISTTDKLKLFELSLPIEELKKQVKELLEELPDYTKHSFCHKVLLL